jgi:His/Glu/Gln/Arg/opine family amino acid ABC transporter permease subunit
VGELVRIALEYREDLLHGLRNTLLVTVAVMASSLALGLALGWASTWRSAVLRHAIAVYVDVFRGIPLLVLLWLVYFGLPTLPAVPILVSPFAAVFIAFTLCYAAYQAEIFRAGIEAVDRGQIEAGLAQGMRYRQVFLRIVLPQTVRVVAPPTVNQFTDIIKSTAMAGTVAYAELFRTANMIGTDNFRFLPAFVLVSLIYAAVCLPLIWWMNRLDARLKRGTAY